MTGPCGTPWLSCITAGEECCERLCYPTWVTTGALSQLKVSQLEASGGLLALTSEEEGRRWVLEGKVGMSASPLPETRCSACSPRLSGAADAR